MLCPFQRISHLLSDERFLPKSLNSVRQFTCEHESTIRRTLLIRCREFCSGQTTMRTVHQVLVSDAALQETLKQIFALDTFLSRMRSIPSFTESAVRAPSDLTDFGFSLPEEIKSGSSAKNSRPNSTFSGCICSRQQVVRCRSLLSYSTWF